MIGLLAAFAFDTLPVVIELRGLAQQAIVVIVALALDDIEAARLGSGVSAAGDSVSPGSSCLRQSYENCDLCRSNLLVLVCGWACVHPVHSVERH